MNPEGPVGVGARRRRPRRSREEVCQALVDAAAALLAERSSGHVTVRDIAARAGVNPALIHRYFGSKRNLVREAMERAQRHVAARIDEVADVVSGGPVIFHAALQERELTAAYARAALDGVEDVPAGLLVVDRLLEGFRSEIETGQGLGRHDPRIIVACLSSATAGYTLLGRYIRHAVGLDGARDDEVETALVAVLQDVARLAFPDEGRLGGGGRRASDDGALSSWNDGPAKAAVLEFVRTVTTPGGSFVPPPERIAAFDNDGTLWCERPLYVQADFIVHRFREMVAADPALARRQPYRAVVEGDREWLGNVYGHAPALVRGVSEAFGGITTEAFDAAARGFFASARHPALGVPYTQVVYRPMLELIDLLEANDFKVYICSAGGRDFVRAVSEQVYGLPRDRVIGSAAALEYRDGDLYRTAEVEQPIDDGPGKPIHIWTRTGRKPLLAGGNADGDVPMLQAARFALLVHHDDEAREFAYDQGAEQALAVAGARGWTVVSMKQDFATVF